MGGRCWTGWFGCWLGPGWSAHREREAAGGWAGGFQESEPGAVAACRRVEGAGRWADAGEGLGFEQGVLGSSSGNPTISITGGAAVLFAVAMPDCASIKGVHQCKRRRNVDARLDARSGPGPGEPATGQGSPDRASNDRLIPMRNVGGLHCRAGRMPSVLSRGPGACGRAGRRPRGALRSCAAERSRDRATSSCSPRVPAQSRRALARVPATAPGPGLLVPQARQARPCLRNIPGQLANGGCRTLSQPSYWAPASCYRMTCPRPSGSRG